MTCIMILEYIIYIQHIQTVYATVSIGLWICIAFCNAKDSLRILFFTLTTSYLPLLRWNCYTQISWRFFVEISLSLFEWLVILACIIIVLNRAWGLLGTILERGSKSLKKGTSPRLTASVEEEATQHSKRQKN